jgi:hypothetical protein
LGFKSAFGVSKLILEGGTTLREACRRHSFRQLAGECKST